MRHHLARRHLALAALALAACLLLAGCDSDKDGGAADDKADAEASATALPADAPLRLRDVDLRHVPTAGGAEALDDAAVDKRVKDTFMGQPSFVPLARKGHGPFKATGTYRASFKDPRDGSGDLIGAVYVNVTLTQAKPTRPLKARYVAEAFVGETLPGKKDKEAELQDLLLKVAEEVALNIAKQLRVDRASEAELVAMIDVKADPELLGFAIDAARAREATAAAPKLVTLLEHPDRDVVNRAAAALGDVGDRSAVGPLIEAGSRVPAVDRLPVLYALGEIGGPEAAIYLDTLAKSNADPRIQAAIEQARDKAKASSGD